MLFHGDQVSLSKGQRARRMAGMDSDITKIIMHLRTEPQEAIEEAISSFAGHMTERPRILERVYYRVSRIKSDDDLCYATFNLWLLRTSVGAETLASLRKKLKWWHDRIESDPDELRYDEELDGKLQLELERLKTEIASNELVEESEWLISTMQKIQEGGGFSLVEIVRHWPPTRVILLPCWPLLTLQMILFRLINEVEINRLFFWVAQHPSHIVDFRHLQQSQRRQKRQQMEKDYLSYLTAAAEPMRQIKTLTHYQLAARDMWLVYEKGESMPAVVSPEQTFADEQLQYYRGNAAVCRWLLTCTQQDERADEIKEWVERALTTLQIANEDPHHADKLFHELLPSDMGWHIKGSPARWWLYRALFEGLMLRPPGWLQTLLHMPVPQAAESVLPGESETLLEHACIFKLLPLERKFLQVMLDQRGELVSVQELNEQFWPSAGNETESVRQSVSKIRAMLREGKFFASIQTEKGERNKALGYRLLMDDREYLAVLEFLKL
jgi:Transcriptional regulatory protein, C terminal